MNERTRLYREAIKLWCDGWPNWVLGVMALIIPKHYLAQAERYLQIRKAMDRRRVKAISKQDVL